MRVGLDATPLTLSSGGLCRYTAQLALALAREFPGDDFVLLSDQPFPLPPQACPNLTRGGGPRDAFERRWWLVGLGRQLERLSAAVFHGTDFAVPYLPRRPSVLTLHDLSPWMDPAWHSAAARVRRRTPALIALGCATMILTDTEGRAPAGHGAVSHSPRAYRRRAAWGAGGAPGPRCPKPRPRPYFLFVGTLEPRKNVAGLVAAWRHVRREREVDLLLAGRRRADFPALGPEPGLELLGEVPDERLPGLYAGALALVYPSFYEGFGLPVLEAMQAGACAIVSPDPALLEVTGGAAMVARGERELALAMSALAAAAGRRAGVEG